MSVKHPTADNGTDNELPGAWTRVPDGALAHNERARFVHQISGQVVRVRRQRRPTQMRDPMTATNDTGYVTRVDGDHSAKLSPDLSAESVARETAREFMAAYPGGDYEVPEPSTWDSGPVEW